MYIHTGASMCEGLDIELINELFLASDQRGGARRTLTTIA